MEEWPICAAKPKKSQEGRELPLLVSNSKEIPRGKSLSQDHFKKYCIESLSAYSCGWDAVMKYFWEMILWSLDHKGGKIYWRKIVNELSW